MISDSGKQYTGSSESGSEAQEESEIGPGSS